VTAAKLAISTVLVTRLMVAAVARRATRPFPGPPRRLGALGGGAPPARHHGDAGERDYMVRVERID
jgi:hypothetical protein